MKTRLPLIAALLAACAAFLTHTGHAQETAPPPPPLSAAVLDFKDGSQELQGVGAAVSALLQVQLTAHSDALLVERAELNEVLAEQELTLSDAVTPAQAAKVAQLTGAEVLISGRVFMVQDRIHLVAKVISSSTSRVFGATSSYDKGKPLDGAVEKLSENVAKMLKEKSTDLRGGPSLEERTLAQVKSLMENRKPGRVYVHIPETIVQVQVPDPAAQTELARPFEAAGWTVVESAEKADLIIRGEAFSEVGIRRGNLWFTRARLEFSVLSPDGKTLKTDRVVCGNVDLAQAISAKGSLQKAGLQAAPVALKAWAEAAKNAE